MAGPDFGNGLAPVAHGQLSGTAEGISGVRGPLKPCAIALSGQLAMKQVSLMAEDLGDSRSSSTIY